MTITETPAAGEFTMTSGCDSNSCDDIPPLQLQLREIMHDARERGECTGNYSSHLTRCRCVWCFLGYYPRFCCGGGMSCCIIFTGALE